MLTNVDDSDSDKENIAKNDAKERRKNFEFLTKRLIWDTNYGKIRCGLCNKWPDGWELEELDRALAHVSKAKGHITLANKNNIACPYCLKIYNSKEDMVIHLRLKEQRDGGCYKIMLCPDSSSQTRAPQDVWDDLLVKNGQEKPERVMPTFQYNEG